VGHTAGLKAVNLAPVGNRTPTLETSSHEGVCGSGFIDPHFLDLGSSWEVSGQLHAPAALPPGKEPAVRIG
jgi:hypothetical protein